MAIRYLEFERRDQDQYRQLLKNRGFISAGYFSSNGFDLKKMRQMALEGRMDAMCCSIGKSIRWYYAEEQAELARLRGELS